MIAKQEHAALKLFRPEPFGKILTYGDGFNSALGKGFSQGLSCRAI